MRRLKVVSDYRSGGVQYSAGEVLEVDESRAAFLFRDAPGCFDETVKAAPPGKDRRARGGRTRKSAGGPRVVT